MYIINRSIYRAPLLKRVLQDGSWKSSGDFARTVLDRLAVRTSRLVLCARWRHLLSVCGPRRHDLSLNRREGSIKSHEDVEIRDSSGFSRTDGMHTVSWLGEFQDLISTCLKTEQMPADSEDLCLETISRSLRSHLNPGRLGRWVNVILPFFCRMLPARCRCGLSSVMRPPAHRRGWRTLACAYARFFSSSSGCPSSVQAPPSWWNAGHARKRPGSLAEAELLSHLAVLLQPEEPIEELFRDFPVVRSDGWGRSTLSPDVSVYGALQATEAALFVEYDGHYRHLMPPGMAADIRKSKALLDFAPSGSYVLRIAHVHRKWALSCEMGEVVVDTWQPSREASLVKALRQVVLFLLRQRGIAMQPRLEAKLQTFVENPGEISRQAAVEFTEKVALERECKFDAAPLHEFLHAQLSLSHSEGEELIRKCPALARCSIEHRLLPRMQFLESCGLTKAEVAKAIARYPSILGMSIEENLKPTVQWLRDLGLTKAEVSKVIALAPSRLGCRIEENLKPTVEWLRDLGLTQAVVAKVILLHPNVLGYSIDKNLKPTVQWLRDLGLTKAEVAKVIARQPQILGYSIEENLKPTVQWLRDLGPSTAAIAKVITRSPSVLGCSIDLNLKPRMQWLRGLGLTKAEVAKLISCYPQISRFSIETLKMKVSWLLEQFSTEWVRRLLVRNPRVLSRRHQLWVRRSQVLRECGKLSVFGSAMMLTDAKFAQRYDGKTRCGPASHKSL